MYTDTPLTSLMLRPQAIVSPELGLDVAAYVKAELG